MQESPTLSDSISESSAKDARRVRIVLGVMLGVYLVSLLALAMTDQIAVIWKSLVVPTLALAAALTGRFRAFIRDWAVFLGAVILFDAGRGVVFGIVTYFQLPVYMAYAIKAERAIFGEPLLTTRVQAALMSNGELGLIDKLLAVVYGSHFLVFLFYGLALWLTRERAFGRFKAAMLLVMYLGLLGYLLFPTVPPWMAAHQYFVISNIQELGAQLFHGSLPNLTAAFELDPVAAMPSLHCAFPTVLTLITFEYFGLWGLAMAAYSMLVFLSTVHLGHHYGVDVLGGIALGVACFLLAFKSDAAARRLGALRLPDSSTNALRLRIAVTALLVFFTHSSGYLASALTGGPNPLPSAEFIARELDGKSPVATYYRGMRAYEANEYPSAQALLTKAALEMPPDSPQDSAFGTLALAAYFNHDYPSVLHAAAKLQSAPPALGLVIAESLVRTGQPHEGFRLLAKIAADHPDEPEVREITARLAPFRHGT
jgi:membrane-associated phospholipid phosphatase